MALTNHLTYLTKNLTNISDILTRLQAKDIFSQDDVDEIDSLETEELQRVDLVKKLAQDWDTVRVKCLQIFRATQNAHCADIIEGHSTNEDEEKA